MRWLLAVASLLWQRSTRPCSGDIRDPALDRPASPQAHYAFLGRKPAPPRSLFLQRNTRSCLLPAFYAKLTQSSTRTWPVILTSVCLPTGAGQTARASNDQRRTSTRPLLLQTNTMNTRYSQPHLRLRKLRFASRHVQFTPGTSRSFSICLRSTLTSPVLMLVRDSMSRCTSVRTD